MADDQPQVPGSNDDLDKLVKQCEAAGEAAQPGADEPAAEESHAQNAAAQPGADEPAAEAEPHAQHARQWQHALGKPHSSLQRGQPSSQAQGSRTERHPSCAWRCWWEKGRRGYWGGGRRGLRGREGPGGGRGGEAEGG